MLRGFFITIKIQTYGKKFQTDFRKAAALEFLYMTWIWMEIWMLSFGTRASFQFTKEMAMEIGRKRAQLQLLNTDSLHFAPEILTMTVMVTSRMLAMQAAEKICSEFI